MSLRRPPALAFVVGGRLLFRLFRLTVLLVARTASEVGGIAHTLDARSLVIARQREVSAILKILKEEEKGGREGI